MLLRCSVGWNSIGAKGAAQLSHGLQANASLILLDLSHNGLGDNGASHLGYALTENQGLKQLDLSNNGIESRACTVWSRLYQFSLYRLYRNHNCVGELSRPAALSPNKRFIPLGAYGTK